MSFRNRGFVAATPRVSQIFKKRNDLINATIPSNADAFLLGTITLDETGTVYAVKVSVAGNHISGVSPDIQRIILWIRCVPANTGLPDLTLNAEMDTINGFPIGLLHMQDGNPAAFQSAIDQKYRFRRKCDAGEELQLIGQSTNVNGAGRSVQVFGLLSAIIRTR